MYSVVKPNPEPAQESDPTSPGRGLHSRSPSQVLITGKQQLTNFLLGYIGLQHKNLLLFWNLNYTLAEDYQNVGHVMDSLTNPITCLSLNWNPSRCDPGEPAMTSAQNADHSMIAAAVSLKHSDEMGIFDLRTGYLTDLYTHEGKYTY